MTTMSIRDMFLNVEVLGHGYPLVLMHGGPSADLESMWPFRACADQFTLVFYDHRCNGRSVGAPVSSMTWENLTADADALREKLGFERWAVLGHSFGGHVALEYALRYPERLSHLVLLDTAGDSRWSQQNAAEVVAERGYSPERVELVRRWFNGEFEPKEFRRIFMRIADAYCFGSSRWAIARLMVHGGWRSKSRPEAAIFAGRHLLKGWTVTDRLGEITVPTLVMAGRHDFLFPPEAQAELASGIPTHASVSSSVPVTIRMRSGGRKSYRLSGTSSRPGTGRQCRPRRPQQRGSEAVRTDGQTGSIAPMHRERG